MNEGKPPKAKWWNRPRPHGPVPDTPPAPPTRPDAEAAPADAPADRDDIPGDPSETAPAQAGTPETRSYLPGGGEAAAGDARRPDPRGDGTDDSGDYELARPVADVGPAPEAVSTDTGSAPVLVPAPAEPDPRLAPEPDRPSSEAVSAGVPGSDPVGVGGVTGDGDHDSARPAVTRPAPLHAPDPHGTPPYGHPGPWAPAPPVQHPTGPHAQAAPLPAAIPAQAQAAPIDPGIQGAPRAAESAAPDPWRNYDPWAAPAPLQQNGGAVPTVTQRRGRTRRALVLGAVVLALVSGGVGGAVGAYLQRDEGTTKVELPQAAEEGPRRAPDSVAGIAAHALPSVVTLHVRGSVEEGTGTGFVLDGRGHILTNNHVIEPAGDGGEISVTFSGGQTAGAKVIGHDSGYDLAVVQVSGVSGLAPLPLGNSDSVQVGDPVVAIGAPFDLANTVTSGIISAKERPITAGGEKGDGTDVSYVDALQTDAPINPGNSGGPLLDSRARVIGINSAIRSADNGSDLESGQAGSIGLGFAIPVNQAKRVAEELINTGRATHPVIGVTLDMSYAGDGAKVGTKAAGGGPPVSSGGPGAKAGIKAGDVITEVDGTRVHSGEELIVRTRAHRPGDRLRLTLRRDGAERAVTLVLGSADGG